MSQDVMKKLRSASQHNFLEVGSPLDLHSESDRFLDRSQTFKNSGESSATSESNSQPSLASGSLHPSTWSVEAYADGLMDELFDEVDHILDEGTDADEPDFSDYISLQTITVPSTNLSSTSPYFMLPRSGLAIPGQERAASSNLGSIDIDSKPSLRSSGQLLDKLLLLLAGLSVVVTGIAILVAQGKLLPNWVADSGQTQTSVSTTTTLDPQTLANEQADQQFVDYVQRSLQVIQQQSGTANTSTPGLTGVPIPTNSNLPTVAINGNTPQVPNRLPTYVPIYPSPQLVVPSVPGLPTIPTAPKVARVPATSPSQAPSWVTIPSTSIAASPAQVSIPAPTLTYTLVGLLQLGSRSAALFDINGNAQRISIGEPIGSSGWTLVKIASQEAIIRRNGEVRSIYVGQKF